MNLGPVLAALVTGAVLVTLTAVVTWSLARRPPSPAPAIVDTVPPASPPEPTVAEDDSLLRERLEMAVDAIDLGLVLCDERGRVVFRNRTARELAAARHARALVEAAVEDLLREALAGRPARREVSLFGPPTEAFIVRATPLDERSGGGAMAIVENTTDRKRTETVRRDFVANISHELKTPIGAMGLLAETLRDETDPETTARLLGRMVREADRASGTVDDLLELSRIEFGEDTEFEVLPVRSVIGEAVGRVTGMAEHRGIPLLIDAPEGLRVHGDRRQLVSAVFNLLDNAVKFSPEGSTVVVGAEEAAGRLLVRVADGGPGIPQRDLDRVFERFYRVDRARSRETGGTGLGLAIVRHVASNHGGDVRVESVEGEGSVFTLDLPAHGESANRASRTRR